MVVLVTGGSGQLGQSISAIRDNYPQLTFYFASSSETDITDSENLKSIFSKVSPDFCINTAAYTAVDKAESEPDKAYAVNVAGVNNLAEICNEFNTVLIHLSTDFVFDGNKSNPYLEGDATNPQGVYAKTKLLGEEIITARSQKYFIIRTSWLYSNYGNNFMKTILRLAAEKPSLNVVDDQVGTPTHAIDLAKVILEIINSGISSYGIYHFSNEGETTWYAFAQKIFEINNIKIPLHPIPTNQFPTPATRPKYSVLDKTKIKTVFGIRIKHWDEALTEYFKTGD